MILRRKKSAISGESTAEDILARISSQTPTSGSLHSKKVGIIAGNGLFPFIFAEGAIKHGYQVIAVCHKNETDPNIEKLVAVCEWIKVGELGKIIATFKQHGVNEVAMAGGINRIRLFGGVKLDARGARLLARLRSTKDDILMRGVAEELAGEGIEVISCTRFMSDSMVEEGVLTKSKPTAEELQDIEVGASALKALSSQNIGQLVAVRDGVVVAVEAIEGSDATIDRVGELRCHGAVIVKFAKPTQDMRFDVPTVGPKTIERMIKAKARVLALETGRCVMVDKERLLKLANQNKIAVIGCKALV